jgi:hypothetical protein
MSFLQTEYHAMEAPKFSIGVHRQKTRQEKRDEIRMLRRAIRKKNLLRANRLNAMYWNDRYVMPPCCQFILHPKRWLLIDAPLYASSFLYTAGQSIVTILSKIHSLKKIRRKTLYLGNRSPPPLAYYEFLALKNQRVRNAFGALARRWIRSRLRPGNDEDLMTGTVVVNPIVLVDWDNRRTYTFEPQTIYRDMTLRLQMGNIFLIPIPMPPRNPYTNIDMNVGQFYSVVAQLRKRGVTHWSIEALHSVQYNMARYEREMNMKLRNTILHATFSNHRDVNGISLVLDFIYDEHGYHVMKREMAVYTWAMEAVPTDPRICAWRNLCYKYYMCANKIPADQAAEMISKESRPLCRPPLELMSQYYKAMKQ